MDTPHTASSSPPFLTYSKDPLPLDFFFKQTVLKQSLLQLLNAALNEPRAFISNLLQREEYLTVTPLVFLVDRLPRVNKLDPTVASMQEHDNCTIQLNINMERHPVSLSKTYERYKSISIHPLRVVFTTHEQDKLSYRDWIPLLAVNQPENLAKIHNLLFATSLLHLHMRHVRDVVVHLCNCDTALSSDAFFKFVLERVTYNKALQILFSAVLRPQSQWKQFGVNLHFCGNLIARAAYLVDPAKISHQSVEGDGVLLFDTKANRIAHTKYTSVVVYFECPRDTREAHRHHEVCIDKEVGDTSTPFLKASRIPYHILDQFAQKIRNHKEWQLRQNPENLRIDWPKYVLEWLGQHEIHRCLFAMRTSTKEQAQKGMLQVQLYSILQMIRRVRVLPDTRVSILPEVGSAFLNTLQERRELNAMLQNIDEEISQKSNMNALIITSTLERLTRCCNNLQVPCPVLFLKCSDEGSDFDFKAVLLENGLNSEAERLLKNENALSAAHQEYTATYHLCKRTIKSINKMQVDKHALHETVSETLQMITASKITAVARISQACEGNHSLLIQKDMLKYLTGATVIHSVTRSISAQKITDWTHDIVAQYSKEQCFAFTSVDRLVRWNFPKSLKKRTVIVLLVNKDFFQHLHTAAVKECSVDVKKHSNAVELRDQLVYIDYLKLIWPKAWCDKITDDDKSKFNTHLYTELMSHMRDENHSCSMLFIFPVPICCESTTLVSDWFQRMVETSKSFISVLRHGSYRNYGIMKRRVFSKQGDSTDIENEDFFLCEEDDSDSEDEYKESEERRTKAAATLQAILEDIDEYSDSEDETELQGHATNVVGMESRMEETFAPSLAQTPNSRHWSADTHVTPRMAEESTPMNSTEKPNMMPTDHLELDYGMDLSDIQQEAAFDELLSMGAFTTNETSSEEIQQSNDALDAIWEEATLPKKRLSQEHDSKNDNLPPLKKRRRAVRQNLKPAGTAPTPKRRHHSGETTMRGHLAAKDPSPPTTSNNHSTTPNNRTCKKDWKEKIVKDLNNMVKQSPHCKFLPSVDALKMLPSKTHRTKCIHVELNNQNECSTICSCSCCASSTAAAQPPVIDEGRYCIKHPEKISIQYGNYCSIACMREAKEKNLIAEKVGIPPPDRSIRDCLFCEHRKAMVKTDGRTNPVSGLLNGLTMCGSCAKLNPFKKWGSATKFPVKLVKRLRDENMKWIAEFKRMYPNDFNVRRFMSRAKGS